MLPVIALPDLDTEDGRARLAEVSGTVGFFYLVDHGVPTELLDRTRDVARAFFALPDEDKASVAMINSPHFRGYNRLGGELTNGTVDRREQIDIGPERSPLPGARGPMRLQGPNQWPSALPALQEAVTDFASGLSGVARRLLARWAVALGASADVFDEAFASPATLIKLIRYPARTDERAADEQGVGAHKDAGVLTILLLEDDSRGLQVERTDGSWIDAPAVDGAFVVNIGEMLEVATDGRLRATRHRVVTAPGAPERLSIPYFFAPSLDAVMPTLDLPPGSTSPGVTSDPGNPLYRTYGENTWKSRIRAHPDVYRRWYPDEAAGRTSQSAANS